MHELIPSIPYVFTEGDYYSRGVQHGKQCKNLIRGNINLYKKICCHQRSIDFDLVKLDIKRFIPVLKKYDMDLFKEIAGIADGAEVSIDDIVLLNVRSEVMNPVWTKASLHEGCSSLIVKPRRTSTGEIFIAQTWDWIQDSKEFIILLHEKDNDNREFLSVTECGMIGKIGCNNRGIGSVLNYLSLMEINPKGIPYNFLLRRILDSDTLNDAQRNIISSPIAFALNTIIGDYNGNAVGYELTSRGIDFYSEPDVLIHTNHIISNKLKVRGQPLGYYKNSNKRYKIMQRFFDTKEVIELEDIVELFSNHSDDDVNICQHPKGNTEFNFETVFSMILELKSLKMHICSGLPCKNKFHSIDLKKVFTALLL